MEEKIRGDCIFEVFWVNGIDWKVGSMFCGLRMWILGWVFLSLVWWGELCIIWSCLLIIGLIGMLIVKVMK